MVPAVVGLVIAANPEGNELRVLLLRMLKAPTKSSSGRVVVTLAELRLVPLPADPVPVLSTREADTKPLTENAFTALSVIELPNVTVMVLLVVSAFVTGAEKTKVLMLLP